MMAMKAILENPHAFGYTLSPDQFYQPYSYTEVTVDRPVDDWVTWAADHGISYLQLREHNPWIRGRSLPNKTNKTYTVKIPSKDSLSRSNQKTTIYNHNWTH